jgi:nicotinate-nucleotide adenylyltransferase
MVELAVGGDAKLVCDTRELQRSGPSFTIDSLIELKGELGEQASISLIMGCDAVLDIGSWYRWQEVLDWAHVVVIARPGWQLPNRGPVAQWLKDNALQDRNGITLRAAGGVHIEHLRPLQISSTEIRAMLGGGLSARYLIPESVLNYIEQHGLYRKSYTN